jgi:Fe-S-cluster containining protein
VDGRLALCSGRFLGMSLPPAEELCVDCGLCCDGTLFGAVPLTDDDRARLRPTGLVAEGQPLDQRCVALDGCRCTIYPLRPQACRHYQCLLLIALKDGEVPLAEAKAVVAEARRRLAQVAASVGGFPRVGSVLSVARKQAPSDFLNDTEEYLRFHFRGHGR